MKKMLKSYKLFLLIGIVVPATMISGCSKKENNETDPPPGEISGEFTDSRDGQVYTWVKIGDQIWMAENLNYETANSLCYNSDTANCDLYGRLYTWDDAQKACPDGWHVSSDSEWCTLTTYIDDSVICDADGDWTGTDAGGILKSTSGWYDDGNGEDAYHFSALPGGYRAYDGFFLYVGKQAYFWTSTDIPFSSAYMWSMSYYLAQIFRISSYQTNLYSIRCVKDQ